MRTTLFLLFWQYRMVRNLVKTARERHTFPRRLQARPLVLRNGDKEVTPTTLRLAFVRGGLPAVFAPWKPR